MLRTLWLFSSFLVVVIVLIQNPKGQSLGGQSQVFGGTRASETFFTRFTWFLALLFLFLTLMISVFDN